MDVIEWASWPEAHGCITSQRDVYSRHHSPPGVLARIPLPPLVALNILPYPAGCPTYHPLSSRAALQTISPRRSMELDFSSQKNSSNIHSTPAVLKDLVSPPPVCKGRCDDIFDSS
ncbi:hypothetical protein CISG_04261 [Coccidioides immitis RMSCC 3703]|uniref:Uncharacterized protein n=2 Tax=Coccidioides immitis TaxID=5501 RepID=A0A0J8QPV2_COCIT|nr:hypothetical protein CIRG_02321 [Coccidioides immitis RMSCC 2394]KMU74554.1 hypothetical protein CISG_04261 [Coccidioides immitis RMSCC 3703]